MLLHTCVTVLTYPTPSCSFLCFVCTPSHVAFLLSLCCLASRLPGPCYNYYCRGTTTASTEGSLFSLCCFCYRAFCEVFFPQLKENKKTPVEIEVATVLLVACDRYSSVCLSVWTLPGCPGGVIIATTTVAVAVHSLWAVVTQRPNSLPKGGEPSAPCKQGRMSTMLSRSSGLLVYSYDCSGLPIV